MKIVVNCISELNEISQSIINQIGDKNIICFYGEMGVGKTTLIKLICEKLGVKDNVSSPTFSVVNEYILSDDQSVFHFDFYRIEKEEEAFDMGYEDYFYNGDLCFIEWPEKVQSIIPEDIMRIDLTKNKDQRIIEIS
ncbi:MAG: tRNA (adenosine(37)-N6)-threonylcarbamoyltransferase complex ATPase subunit type 1 TsaE [Flavobacteriales bacterium]|nr:tRNA (adenosine(37)-N6)-threonylcarbamoyltransferase complex ATPase subunit type 1 TsaE [Flavobacteriales bacterium]|tara:strand:+ start:760 stop:1170 length:411 start_codon:yes stop_codon:yes gene_type:complete